MIVCRGERFADYIDELRPLASDHWWEAGCVSPVFEPSIDFEMYRAYDEAGFLVSVIARVDGAIVGWWGGVLHPDPHSSFAGRQAMMLSQALLWLLPRYRGWAWLLIKAVEREARSRGASLVHIEAPPKAARFFVALGYKTVGMSFVKLIGEAADAERLAGRAIAVG